MLLQSLLRPVLTPLMRGMFDAPIASSPAWSPLDLPSLGAWYDPSDLTTMFQDAAGTTPVTAAGQPVGLILDKSGNGYHASQSTSTARPLFQIDGGGNAYLSFDGVDDILICSSITIPQPYTVFAGAHVLATNGCIINSAGGGGSICQIIAPFGNAIDMYAGSHLLGGPAIGFDNPVVLALVYDGASAYNRKNGVLNASGDVGTGGVIGNLMVGSDNSAFLNGKIYQFILGAAAYDAATVLEAETWVADKTGVTL